MTDWPQRSELQLEDGPRLSLLEWGDRGPLCLLYHANGFCAGTWSRVATELAGDFHVVALDARGHGQSESGDAHGGYNSTTLGRDLIAVAQQLLERRDQAAVSLVVGHSFGGVSALHAGVERPELFERILMLDPVIIPAEHLAGRPAGSSPLVRKTLSRREHFDSRDAAREAWQGSPFFAGWDAGVFEDYLRYGLRDRPGGGVTLSCDRRVEAAIFAAPLWDPTPDAHRVQARVVLQRSRASNFPEYGHQRVVDAIPRAWLETTEAGHLIPMEQPLQTAARIRRMYEL